MGFLTFFVLINIRFAEKKHYFKKEVKCEDAKVKHSEHV